MNSRRRRGVRLTVALVGVFVVVIGFTGRLIDLQVVQAPQLAAKAAQNREAKIVTYGTRGAIVDTNGVVLADSVDRFDITASPKQMLTAYNAKADDPTTQAQLDQKLASIAKLTGQDSSDLSSAIVGHASSDYLVLTKKVTLATFDAVTALTVIGVYSNPVPARSYPNGAVAGNLVGFVGTDGAQAGIELAYNKCLASKNGSSTYEKAQDGTRIPGSTIKQTDPVDGGTIKLTIDRDLQYEVQEAIDKQRKVLGAPWATAVVERVKDGHLMAVADDPTVDPNNVSAAKRTALGSLAFSTPYEPGSTFKGMSAAAMIDAGTITPTTEITVPSVYTNGLPKGAYIKDSFAHGTLRYTTAGVLENSSNIGISILSQSTKASVRYDYMKKFGVGSKTAATFPGASGGYLTPPSQWDAITNRSVEFGQGVSATSVQVAQIYSTLANGGVREPTTLVESCTKPDGTVTDTPTTKPVRVVSEKTATEVDRMLETVVTGGPISALLKIPGYRIAAKTGTAQVAKAGGGGYGNDYIISVAGMVPANDPQYVVVVTFGPTTLGTSAGAAPAFKNVMMDVIRQYRIQPSTTPAPFVKTTW